MSDTPRTEAGKRLLASTLTDTDTSTALLDVERLAAALRECEQDVDLADHPWDEQVPAGWRHRDLARRLLENMALDATLSVTPQDTTE